MALSVHTRLAIESWQLNGRPASGSRAAWRYVARTDPTAADMQAMTNASPSWSMIGLPNASRSWA